MPVLVVTAGERDADAVADLLRCVVPDRRVETFPAWETLPHERLSPRADTVGRRLAVLRDLTHPGENGTIDVLVAPVRSVLQPLAPGLGDLVPVELKPGDEAELDDIGRALVDAAYTRVELVEKRGEFAVRGGLLDVFPPTEPHPVRVEFWGDEVDELRYFSAADQRSLDERPERLWAPPCRELLLTAEVRERAAALAVEHPELTEILGKLAEGIAVEGMESLIPALVAGRDAAAHRPGARAARTCWSATPSGCAPAPRTWCARPRSSSPRPGRRRPEAGQAPIDLGASSFRDLAEVETAARMRGLPWWTTGVVHARQPRTTTSTSPSTRRPSTGSPATCRSAVEQVRALDPRRLAGRRHLRRARAPRSAPPTSSPRPTSASGWCPTSPPCPTAA